MTKNEKRFTSIIRNSSVHIFLASLAVLGTIFNLYLASKLTPVVQDINRLDSRVSAVEKWQGEKDPLVERFLIVEERIKDIAEIKASVLRIENKIDSAINQ